MSSSDWRFAKANKNAPEIKGNGGGVATKAKIAGEVACAAGAGVLAEREAAQGDQDLLPFDLPVADPSGKIEDARQRARGSGRPQGAENKATVAMREYLLKRGVLPQAALLQWFQLGPVGMAEAIGIHDAAGRLECLKVWAKIGGDLGRYFMAPMAPSDDQGKAVPFIQVTVGGDQGVRLADGQIVEPWRYLEAELNQQLNEVDAGKSQDGESQE